jgi:spore coat polysaccharide biosynthesis protein SpsF
MILAIVQARVTSSRLPGKVVRPLLGVPMLLRQIERISQSKQINRLLVATSNDKTDNVIGELCNKHNISCYRGDLYDVLKRFYEAALPYSPDHVVRLTGDCPLIDPEIMDHIIRFHIQGGYDYTSNTIEPSFPDGLDVEVIRFTSLKEALVKAKRPSEREHVTPYIYQHPKDFRIGSYKTERDLSYLRWTVDELEDFYVIEQIFKDLYPNNPKFSTSDILSYLANHSYLKDVNKRYNRNEGYKKSLENDEKL